MDFRVTWVFQNSGKCDWPSNFKFIRIQGDDEIEVKPWEIKGGKPIQPGQNIEITLQMKAPEQPG